MHGAPGYAPLREPFLERLLRRFFALLVPDTAAAAGAAPSPPPPAAGSSLFALNVSGSVELLPLPHA